MTSKVLSTGLAACILAAAAATAAAAEESDFVGPQPRNAAAQPNLPTGAAAGPRDVVKDKDDYLAAVDKCERLEAVAAKQQCLKAVRKEFGQM